MTSIGAAAGWIAPAATVLAAMMTASNLGARLTGWGFVVFLIGSVGWCTVALATDQPNLLWTNAFLALVNLVGIWRWLGRQAKYEKGGKQAADRSARARVPSLVSIAGLAGSKLLDRNGASLGLFVDAMMRCSDAGLAYVVVSEGGVVGVGERLHALGPDELEFSETAVTSRIGAEELSARPILGATWPAAL